MLKTQKTQTPSDFFGTFLSTDGLDLSVETNENLNKQNF